MLWNNVEIKTLNKIWDIKDGMLSLIELNEEKKLESVEEILEHSENFIDEIEVRIIDVEGFLYFENFEYLPTMNDLLKIDVYSKELSDTIETRLNELKYGESLSNGSNQLLYIIYISDSIKEYQGALKSLRNSTKEMCKNKEIKISSVVV